MLSLLTLLLAIMTAVTATSDNKQSAQTTVQFSFATFVTKAAFDLF